MKKRFSYLLAAFLLGSLFISHTLAANESVSVMVDDTPVRWTDAQPFVHEGRTMVPLRAVAEAMDLKVTWNSSTNTAAFSQSSAVTLQGKPYTMTKTIFFTVNQKTAKTEAVAERAQTEPMIGTDTISMDVAPMMRNDRTYAPIRYLAEYFDFRVGWDNRTVKLSGIPGGRSTDFVAPAAKGETNLLVGTWELDSSRWTEQSKRQIGIVQDTVHLIFRPDGEMAYQLFDQLHRGKYWVNAKNDGETYAVAKLENGWIVHINLLNLSMSAQGFPQVQAQRGDGTTYTTDVWEFYHLNDRTGIGVDPWL